MDSEEQVIMPIARISFDQSLSDELAARAAALIPTLSNILAVGLASDRANPQVILQPGAYISGPYLIYVDLQFRATPLRDKERVTQVLTELADVLNVQFQSAVRLRGFAIDQSTLSAVDFPPAGRTTE